VLCFSPLRGRHCSCEGCLLLWRAVSCFLFLFLLLLLTSMLTTIVSDLCAAVSEEQRWRSRHTNNGTPTHTSRTPPPVVHMTARGHLIITLIRTESSVTAVSGSRLGGCSQKDLCASPSHLLSPLVPHVKYSSQHSAWACIP
jgi:hypothetical protein